MRARLKLIRTGTNHSGGTGVKPAHAFSLPHQLLAFMGGHTQPHWVSHNRPIGGENSQLSSDRHPNQ